jgi:hypothetical protein
MTHSDVVLTHGASQVRAMVNRLSAAEVARRARTGEAMVRHIATGRRTPGEKLKERFVPLGIELGAWTMPMATGTPARLSQKAERAVSSVERETRSAELAGDAEKGSAIRQLVDTVADIDRQLEEVREGSSDAEDGGVILVPPLSHIASLTRVKVAALAQIARLRGEGEITPAMIRRSRAWQDCLAVIEGVLAKHPEAARDFAAAMAKLGGE